MADAEKIKTMSEKDRTLTGVHFTEAFGHAFLADTWRNYNVMTSKRRRFDVTMTLSLRHVFIENRNLLAL